MAYELQVSVESTQTGPLNPAICTFHYGIGTGTPPFSIAETSARAIAFLAIAEAVMAEGGVKITGVKARGGTIPGFFDIPFPTTEYGNLRTTYGAFDPGIIPLTAYGTSLNGSGNTSSGRGDSICLSFKGATTTGTATGRLFIPYLARQSVASNGLIDEGNAVRVEQAYSFLFLGLNTRDAITPPLTPDPVIFSRKPGVTAKPILQAKIARIPSRLRSRTK